MTTKPEPIETIYGVPEPMHPRDQWFAIHERAARIAVRDGKPVAIKPTFKRRDGEPLHTWHGDVYHPMYDVRRTHLANHRGQAVTACGKAFDPYFLVIEAETKEDERCAACIEAQKKIAEEHAAAEIEAEALRPKPPEGTEP